MKTDKIVIDQIFEFIDKIENYLKNVSYESFESDYKTQDAVLRNIELIGEAANRLSTQFRNTNSDFPIMETISMRNRLIHGYDDIDLRIVWSTIKIDIPKLKLLLTEIAK